MQRREEQARSGANSTFAEVIASLASGVLPREATQPCMIYGGKEAIYKACSAPAAYTISEELRKKEAVPMTADEKEIGIGGGV